MGAYEIDADCGDETVEKLVILESDELGLYQENVQRTYCKAEEERGLADATVANKKQLEEVGAARMSPLRGHYQDALFRVGLVRRLSLSRQWHDRSGRAIVIDAYDREKRGEPSVAAAR